MEPTTPPRRFAVLIDADNVSATALTGLLAEVANYGVAMVKRIYGDWTLPNLKSWKEQLLEHAIQPIQQFDLTKGKNATDIALVIDAMDLLHSGRFDGFCLVSSDSDFTRLASRLREEGADVYGFGGDPAKGGDPKLLDLTITVSGVSNGPSPSMIRPPSPRKMSPPTALVRCITGMLPPPISLLARLPFSKYCGLVPTMTMS